MFKWIWVLVVFVTCVEKRKLPIFVFITILCGCSEGDSDYSGRKIDSFRIIDSYQRNSDEIQMPGINASIAQGEYQVFWETDSTSAYYMSLSLSHDDISQGMTIYDQYCGRKSSDCSSSGELVCHFTTSLIMSCGEIGPDFPLNTGLDLNGILTQLPEEFNLSLAVCKESLDECNYRTIPVVLQ
jgi:hypothetical protein